MTSTGLSWERIQSARHYKSKSDFIAGTFAKLGKVLPDGAQLHVEHLLEADNQAVVELHFSYC